MNLRVVWAVGAFFWVPEGVQAQPITSVIDSIVLEQSPEAYLTVPISVVPDGNGYLIADAQQPHVFRFLRSGRFDRLYGEEGEGPGEFKELALALPYDQGQILALSWSPPAAQAFDRLTGRFAQRFALDGGVGSAVLDSGELWVSGVSYETRTALRHVALGSGTVTPMAAIPSSYRSGDPLHGIFPEIPFAKWGDTILVGFEPLSELLLMTVDGVEIDRFHLPAEWRRGTPEDPGAAILDAFRGGPYERVFGTLSATRGIHRRVDGTILIVHFDSRAETPPVSSEVFVSVLAPNRETACLDAKVPLSPEAQPAIGFEGDELLILEQVLVGFDVQAVLRRVVVDTQGCRWTPVVR